MYSNSRNLYISAPTKFIVKLLQNKIPFASLKLNYRNFKLVSLQNQCISYFHFLDQSLNLGFVFRIFQPLKFLTKRNKMNKNHQTFSTSNFVHIQQSPFLRYLLSKNYTLSSHDYALLLRRIRHHGRWSRFLGHPDRLSRGFSM